jgi:hypothetical protein
MASRSCLVSRVSNSSAFGPSAKAGPARVVCPFQDFGEPVDRLRFSILAIIVMPVIRKMLALSSTGTSLKWTGTVIP